MFLFVKSGRQKDIGSAYNNLRHGVRSVNTYLVEYIEGLSRRVMYF